MAASSSKVVVVIVGKDELSDVAKKVKDSLENLDNQNKRHNETLSQSVMLGNLYSRALESAWQYTKSFGERAFQSASQFEQFQTSLTVLTGSAENANKVLDELNKFSIKTPFQPEEVMAAGRSLVAYQFKLQDIEKWLTVAGEAASTFADKINLEQMVDTLGRLRAGQFGEAFEQLRRIGISIQDLRGEGLQFDKGGQYVGSVQKALDAVEKIILTRYGGMMEKQSQTWAGLMSTAQGYIDEFLRKAMDSGAFDFLKGKLEEIVKTLEAALESGEFEKWAKEAGAVIEQVVTSLWDITKWLVENKDLLIQIGKVLTVAFATDKIISFGKKISETGGALVKATQKAEGLYNKLSLSKSLSFGSLIGSIGLLAGAVATVNYIFDRLNAAMDEYEKLAQKNYSESQKSVNYQMDIQRRYVEEFKKIYEKNYKNESDLNAAAIASWRKKRTEIGFTNTLIYSEAVRLAQNYAKKHKDIMGKVILEPTEKKVKGLGKTVDDLSGDMESLNSATNYYDEYLKEISKSSIPEVTKKFEALDKILNDQSITSQMTREELNKYTEEYNKIGVALGKFQMANEDFIDDLGEEEKKIMEVVNAMRAWISLLPNMQGLWDWGGGGGGSAEQEKSDIEEIAQGLVEWNEGMAEFLNLIGLAGGELDNVAEGVRSIGEGIIEIINSGENSIAMLNGINSLGQGLANIFGGEDSDMNKLISGASNIGTGVAKALSGDLSGIVQALAGIPDLLDGLFESFQESFEKQWSAQGFDDSLSEDLLDKIEEVSDKYGGKEYGMRAYIEEIFDEVDISNKEEFSRLSDLLNEQIGEYVAQGHTVEEAYDKYGDELQDLLDAQEQYGFETTESLEQMLKLQKEQTSEGRIGGIEDAISGIDQMIEGLSSAGYSEKSFSSVFSLLSSSIEKLKAEGLTIGEIYDAVYPTLEKAKEAAEEAGYSTASIQKLIDYTEKLASASGVLDVISGLQTAIEGLSDTGTMTQADLNNLSQTALESYQKLQSQGFSETEIAAQMGGTLSELVEAADRFGFTLPKEIEDLAKTMDELGYGAEKTDAEVLQEWSDKNLVIMQEWGDKMIKSLEDLAGYAEGGIVPGSGSAAQLAWVHPGETVIPPGAVPYSVSNYITQQGQSSTPIELRVIIEEKSGGQEYLKNLIGVTVEAGTKNGEITISEASIK